MRPILALLAIALASSAMGQSPGDPPPMVLTIQPADAPRPALKYRIVPERLSMVPGNAAIFYHRALQMAIQRQTQLDVKRKEVGGPRAVSIDDDVSKWINGPIAEIPRDQARTLLEAFREPLKEVELGTSRSTCDWEFDRRTDGFYLLLPDIQSMRSLARLVSLKARLAILEGKTDEAIHWVQTGLVMGRHVSQGPVVIQGLVGVAIDFVMIRCLEDLVQAPGTPSLYWALADRPRPFIDMRASMEGERTLLEKEIPGVLELDRGPWSLEQARKFTADLQRKLFALVSGDPVPEVDSTAPVNTHQLSRQLWIAAMTAKIYPEARLALIAEGRSTEVVDAMPIVQVSTLYCYREYRRLIDEMFKWMSLPYWQSHDRVDRALATAIPDKAANPLLTMFWGLIPALNAARMANVRLDRQLDAIQAVEAIRLYAATHEGRLPPNLEAIREAPVPVDSAMARPFDYKVEGNSATLSAGKIPGSPEHPAFRIRYDLKLAQ